MTVVKIPLYVRADKYGEVTIQTEAEHLENIQIEFNLETMDLEDSEQFAEFLNDSYSPLELYRMDEEERSEAFASFREAYFKNFDTNYQWEKIEKEIEIGG